MLTTIDRLLRAFEENDILYCHWKSNEHLEEALVGDTDLDVLFDINQQVQLEKIFSECGLKLFRATPLMKYNDIVDYIGYDYETAKIWHVHTHYQMTLGEKHLKGYTVTPWTKTLLADRIQTKSGVWTSDPSDEFVLLMCRSALKLRWRDRGRDLGKDDRIESAWLKQRTSAAGIEAAADRMVGAGSKALIMKLYETELKSKNQFWGLQRTLRKELRQYTPYNRVSSWFTRTLRELFWFCGGVKRRLGIANYKPNRRISTSGGHVVAFLGCDGAGKSTTISSVAKEFNKKIDVVKIYFGSGDGSSSLIRTPMRAVARRVGGKGVGRAVDEEYESKKKVSLKSRLYSVAKIIWAVSLAREKKSKYRLMNKARANGLLVLTDRYPQCICPGMSDGPLLNRYQSSKGLLKRISDWERRVYESFSVDGPDLAIKLIAPTDLAIERKPEMTVEQIEKKKSIVMSMDIAGKSAVIDTSVPLEKSKAEVMKQIWDLL